MSQHRVRLLWLFHSLDLICAELQIECVDRVVEMMHLARSYNRSRHARL